MILSAFDNLGKMILLHLAFVHILGIFFFQILLSLDIGVLYKIDTTSHFFTMSLHLDLTWYVFPYL